MKFVDVISALTWKMGRSRFVVNIPKWKWTESEHMYKQKPRRTWNSFHFFYAFFLLSLCPFIFFFIVYTLNWLHFWHWRRKKGSRTWKKERKFRKQRNSLGRLGDDDSRVLGSARAFSFFRLDWNWIDKQSDPHRPLNGQSFREGFAFSFRSLFFDPAEKEKQLFRIEFSNL